MFDTTIAAVATALGTSGISIIKISGCEAFAICDRLFVCPGGFLSKEANTITYGKIVDPDTGETVDRVLVSKMAAPRTYTGEDVVEINCHGGIVVTRRVLQLVLQAGAVAAAPGEFTKRAFINNKMDLLEAEATMDLIGAGADKAAKVAVQQLEGKLSSRLGKLADGLGDICAKIDLSTDFDELDSFDYSPQDVAGELEPIISGLRELSGTFESGRRIRDGLYVVICGRPNAGKSSLLNRLLGEERAIVTDIPGTTRDTVEEAVSLGGYMVRFVDTAGLRQDENLDPVEQIGIHRAYAKMESADMIIYMVDLGRDLELQADEAEETCAGYGGNIPIVLAANKVDLSGEQRAQEFIDRMKQRLLARGMEIEAVSISALSGIGVTTLTDLILKQCQADDELISRGILVNERQRQLVRKAIVHLDRAYADGKAGYPLDILYTEISSGAMALNELTGRHIDMEAIDKMFSSFCVGK